MSNAANARDECAFVVVPHVPHMLGEEARDVWEPLGYVCGVLRLCCCLVDGVLRYWNDDDVDALLRTGRCQLTDLVRCVSGSDTAANVSSHDASVIGRRMITLLRELPYRMKNEEPTFYAAIFGGMLRRFLSRGREPLFGGDIDVIITPALREGEAGDAVSGIALVDFVNRYGRLLHAAYIIVSSVDGSGSGSFSPAVDAKDGDGVMEKAEKAEKADHDYAMYSFEIPAALVTASVDGCIGIDVVATNPDETEHLAALTRQLCLRSDATDDARVRLPAAAAASSANVGAPARSGSMSVGSMSVLSCVQRTDLTCNALALVVYPYDFPVWAPLVTTADYYAWHAHRLPHTADRRLYYRGMHPGNGRYFHPKSGIMVREYVEHARNNVAIPFYFGHCLRNTHMHSLMRKQLRFMELLSHWRTDERLLQPQTYELVARRVHNQRLPMWYVRTYMSCFPQVTETFARLNLGHCVGLAADICRRILRYRRLRVTGGWFRGKADTNDGQAPTYSHLEVICLRDKGVITKYACMMLLTHEFAYSLLDSPDA